MEPMTHPDLPIAYAIKKRMLKKKMGDQISKEHADHLEDVAKMCHGGMYADGGMTHNPNEDLMASHDANSFPKIESPGSFNVDAHDAFKKKMSHGGMYAEGGLVDDFLSDEQGTDAYTGSHEDRQKEFEESPHKRILNRIMNGIRSRHMGR